MAPPSATHDPVETGVSVPNNGHDKLGTATHEPGLTKPQAEKQEVTMPKIATRQVDSELASTTAKIVKGQLLTHLADPYKEREYQKGRLALAFRIFAKLGFDEGVAGHITLRDPVEPDSFWVNPFGVAWPLLKASDLIRVNKEGKVVDGGPCRLLNAAAYMIHHAVHTARPEINCVAHSHSIYGRSFCSLGRNLDIITQDSCAFHNDIALYTSFRGIVLAEEEGIAIAKALGGKKAALLQNHGLLTCGETIESAVFWFMSLEKCCHAQLLADAAAGGRGGETVKIDEKDAAYTYQTIGTEGSGWFSAKPTFDTMEHQAGVDYK